VIKVHYIHALKSHDETHYFVDLIYANKKDEKWQLYEATEGTQNSLSTPLIFFL
jgi:hypothetical protein